MIAYLISKFLRYFLKFLPVFHIIYNYSWTPLKTYGLYNVPNKPELNLVEYTPNILSKLEAPSKMDYLTHLSYMDLLKEIIVPTFRMKAAVFATRLVPRKTIVKMTAGQQRKKIYS